MPMFCNLKVQVVSSCTERNPIRRRTQPDQTANATRSDGGRNPIRRRTQSDQTANAIRHSPIYFYIRKWKLKIQKTLMYARWQSRNTSTASPPTCIQTS